MCYLLGHYNCRADLVRVLPLAFTRFRSFVHAECLFSGHRHGHIHVVRILAATEHLGRVLGANNPVDWNRAVNTFDVDLNGRRPSSFKKEG